MKLFLFTLSDHQRSEMIYTQASGYQEGAFILKRDEGDAVPQYEIMFNRRVQTGSSKAPSSGRGGRFSERGRGGRGGRFEGGRGGRGGRFEGGEGGSGEGGRGRGRGEYRARGRGRGEGGRGGRSAGASAGSPPGLGSSAAVPVATKEAPKETTTANLYALLGNSDE